jgi:hypothetical protein
MSDYLWDKTGARDAEVERLEDLLGQLRHRPQPFTLPDELTTAGAHNAAASGVEEAEATRAPFGGRALPARRHVRTSWLAVAAVLLLAFVALALALLRTGTTGSSQQSAPQVSVENSQQRQQQQSAGNQQQYVGQQEGMPSNQPAPLPTQDNVTPSRNAVATAGAPEKRDEQVIAGGLAKENRRGRQLAPKERQPGLVAKREQPRPTRGAATNTSGSVTPASRQANPNDLPLEARLAAKEQLMYALRLTSSKLSEVRAKTMGLGDAKQGFVEGNRK